MEHLEQHSESEDRYCPAVMDAPTGRRLAAYLWGKMNTLIAVTVHGMVNRDATNRTHKQ